MYSLKYIESCKKANDTNESVKNAVTEDDIQAAETMKNMVSSVNNDRLVVVEPEYDLDNFEKFEMEYLRKKKIHEEYVKRKEEEQRQTEIEYHKRLEKERKTDGLRYSDSSGSEDENNDTKDIYPGVVAPFSFLITQIPYDFQQYIPLNSNETQKKRDKNMVFISYNHVPVGQSIGDEYVIARLKFLNEKAEKDDPAWTVCISFRNV